MRECGNPCVLESIRTSMMRRFGTAGQLSDFSLQKKSNPGNALRPYHFGCKTVLVVDDDTRSRCMNFITSEKILSLDTESTCPRFDDDHISLIQIGTSTEVYIIQVARQSPSFMQALEERFRGKHLLTWGPEKTALEKVVKCNSCIFQDVQREFFTSGGKGKGVADCILDLFDGRYTLDKSWTCSGWDNDELTREQLKYATLDVVCTYVLFFKAKYNVECFRTADSSQNHITFLAHNLTQGVTKEHGFSCTEDFLGHNHHGIASSSWGFVITRPDVGARRQIHAKGFQVCVNNVPPDQINVDAFCSLLDKNKFCCTLCSACFETYKTWDSCTRTDDTGYVFMRPNEPTVQKRIDRVASDDNEQRAYYCASAVAECFSMIAPQKNFPSLVKAVRSDIYFGYIRDTLVHLTSMGCS
jgi:hypothetical protein